jgi:ribose transport system substrate-binding protein
MLNIPMKTLSSWLIAWALSLLTLAATAAPIQIAVIPKSVGNEYWAAVQAGAMRAKADLATEGIAVDILWKGTEREDQIDQQKQIVADFVAQKVDAIVLAPMHARYLVPAVEAAVAAKVPVILIDSSLNSAVATSTVATDNYRAGMFAARRLAEVPGMPAPLRGRAGSSTRSKNIPRSRWSRRTSLRARRWSRRRRRARRCWIVLAAT